MRKNIKLKFNFEIFIKQFLIGKLKDFGVRRIKKCLLNTNLEQIEEPCSEIQFEYSPELTTLIYSFYYCLIYPKVHVLLLIDGLFFFNNILEIAKGFCVIKNWDYGFRVIKFTNGSKIRIARAESNFSRSAWNRIFYFPLRSAKRKDLRYREDYSKKSQIITVITFKQYKDTL